VLIFIYYLNLAFFVKDGSISHMTKEIREQIHQKLYYGSNLNNPRPYEDSQEKILDYLEWY